MKSYLRTTLFFLLIAFSISNTKAQKFSEAQRQILEKKATELVQSYNDLMQMVAQKGIDDIEKVRLMEGWFGSNEFLLYNRIAPENNSEFLSIKEYVATIREDYPSGIIFKTELDNSKEIELGLLKEGSGQLHVNIPIKSSITGVYKGKKIVNSKKDLFLLYSFSKSGKTGLSNIKFEGFRLENDLFPLANYSYRAVEAFGGMSFNMFELTSNAAYLINTDDSKTTQFGFSYYQSFSKYIGVNIGLMYQMSSVSLDWNKPANYVYFTSNGTETSVVAPANYAASHTGFLADIDDDKMLPFVTSSGMNDTRKINTLAIPINIELKYDVLEKYTAYIIGGVELLYKLSSTITTNGEFTTQGYYPDYDFTLHDLPDYGYTTEAINTKYTVKSSSFSIAPYGGVGVKVFVYEGFAINLQFMATYPLKKDFFFEYENNTEVLPFSPEYTSNQFITEQLNLSQAASDKPWVQLPGDYSLSYGVNIGIMYKF